MKHATRMLASELGLRGTIRIEFIRYVENGDVMPNSLYTELFKTLMPKMPYEVAKGKRSDPEKWIHSWIKGAISSSLSEKVPCL